MREEGQEDWRNLHSGSFTISVLSPKYLNDQIAEGEIVGAYTRHGTDNTCIHDFSDHLQGRELGGRQRRKFQDII
jgi:hypothetical protein